MRKYRSLFVLALLLFPLGILAQGPPPPPPPPGLPLGSVEYFLLIVGFVYGIIEIRKSS